MEVTKILIDHLANLSKLSFTEPEKIVIQRDLQEMLSFVEKLATIDTKDIAPLLYLTQNINQFRADAAETTIERMAALSNAPTHTDAFFLVPKVIKK